MAAPAPRSSSAIRYVTLRPEGMMAYQETFVQRDQHRIYVRIRIMEQTVSVGTR